MADSFYFDDYSVLNHAGASWQWTFQGGSPATSTLRNPAVYFASPGTHLAILTITDGSGHSDTDSLQVAVNNYVEPTFVQEGFQSSFPPADIFIENPNGDYQWSQYSSAGGFGTSSQCSIFDNYDNDSQGNWDDMRLSVDFTAPANSLLTFDVAHSCYGGQYTDTLKVLASTDCGATFTQLYSKWGSTLATAPSSQNFFQPTPAQWRTDTVDLSAYVGTPQLIVAIRNVGLYGNTIYVDNINIANDNTTVKEVKQTNFDVYPNPVSSNGALTIANPLNEKLTITMFDQTGRVVMKNNISSSGQINLAPYKLSEGIYYLNLYGETRIMNFKIVVK